MMDVECGCSLPRLGFDHYVDGSGDVRQYGGIFRIGGRDSLKAPARHADEQPNLVGAPYDRRTPVEAHRVARWFVCEAAAKNTDQCSGRRALQRHAAPAASGPCFEPAYLRR